MLVWTSPGPPQILQVGLPENERVCRRWVIGCLCSSAGNRLPIVFCNVSGTEEMDQAMLKSAEDAISNRTEAEKVVSVLTTTIVL